MASHSKQFVRYFVATYPHIFDGLNSLVDVGGGTGTAVKIIAEAFPFLRCTVLDLPRVVANALKDDSFDVVGGDMFVKIPPADAILLKVTHFPLKSKTCVSTKQCLLLHELEN
jgi:trans-resveratrol di-O-methyltransferase